MAEKAANLGYFVSKDQPNKNADNVCVLVVHYNFENTNDESWIREGDAEDVENLKNTYKVNRKCNFHDELSPEKGKLLKLLSNQEELLEKFGCTDVPSVFVLYILSHGDSDGKIFTDHYQNEDPNDFICFTTTEIFESLKMLTGFEDCLKLINFGPCRGELIDAIFYENDENFKNENSCRITYSPLMRNTVVFYSTVETTKAKRDQKGTTFAFLTCHVLNSLEEDESLINVLTTIQYESHKVAVKEKTGQTPEVKMFSQDRNFVFSRSSSNDSSSSKIEAKSVKIKRKHEFYSWKSSSGENLRHRLAFLISAKPNNKLFKEFKRELSQNLDFETSERMLRGNPLASINKASRLDSDIGCVLLVFFGLVSENEDTSEVCVEVDGTDTSISEILHEFIGPKNDQWIGKPKILFLVNQETSSFDAIKSTQKPKITATNHSGWLVLVLHNTGELQKLIELFNGQELKKKRSLQELLANLLISESSEKCENRDMLNSTLQYLLNFPDWPRSFVKLNFLVTNSKQSRQERVSFDSLVKESARKKQIWILSSVAGSGKTTILREMAFQLGKLNPELKILRVPLPRVLFSKDLRYATEIEFLVKVTHNSQEDIKKSIENENCVVILDGFDEIRPESQKTVLKVIEALEKKRVTVWIGTRPQETKTVQKLTPKAVLVEIDTLNEEQQIDLLKLETGKSREECKQFIKNFKSIDILQNPLHLSLVAKYEVEGNLYQIYDQVVRQKVEHSLVNQGFDQDNENIFPGKLNEALKSLRQIASCKIRGVELINKKSKDLGKINYYGIATFHHNNVFFIHQTFAEFLAAQQFLLEIEDIGDCESQTMTGDGANLLFEQSFSGCTKFVDLFYSTITNDEEKIKEHKASFLNVMKLNPDSFLKSIVSGRCINIFKMIYPMIAFCKTQGGNCISVKKNKTLFSNAIDGSEEIAIMLLDTDLINSQDELLIVLPYLLNSVAESNACHFFEKLKKKYPRLPEMIHSRRFFIDAGVIAARENNGEILELLLQNGVDIDIIHEMEGNALHCAVTYGALMCVEVLLNHGAKLAVDCRDNIFDPLILAVKENHVDVVKYLLEETISGLQRNKETFEIKEVKTKLNAFHSAIQEGHTEVAKLLIEKSPSLKYEENDHDESPLQFSARRGCLELCQWLVDEEGVDVETLQPSDNNWCFYKEICSDHFLILQKSDSRMTDERGKTALHCAAENGYLERVQELIKARANIRAVDTNGWNAFHFACKCNNDNHKEKVIRLLHSTDSQLAKEKTKSGETGLHILLKLSKYHSVEKVCFLVEEIGVDARAKDKNGFTALLIAYNEGKECVDYLMTKDINLDVKNKRGQTCLHVAAENDDLDALQTWIELGGDLDSVDNGGLTALHIAAESGHLQFVKKLLASKPEATEAQNLDVSESSSGSSLVKYERVNRCDNEGRTALHLAAKSENVDLVKWLLENNADLTLTDMKGNNAIHYAIENERMLRFINEKNGHLVNQRLKDGNTTLHLMIQCFCSKEVVAWILEQGDIDINAKNNLGDTPLLMACKELFSNVAELLLTRNVDVNVPDTRGKTAMHYAAERGKLGLVQKMYKKGADLTLTDSEGMNTLHHATQHFEVFSFLHEKDNDLLNQRLKNGDTTLHLAIRCYGYFGTTNAIILFIVELCENDLNVLNNEGETPLLLACKMRNWIFAKMLLEKAVDIHVTDKNGRTALHYAVNLDNHFIPWKDPDAFDLVEELCKKGADLTLTDNDGMNAFHHAITNHHMALNIHGLNGDLVKERLKNGDTSLHLAIKVDERYINESLLTWLVEQNFVDLNARNAMNETPLILACKGSNHLRNIVKILLSKGVDVNIRDNKGKFARDYVEKFCPIQIFRKMY